MNATNTIEALTPGLAAREPASNRQRSALAPAGLLTALFITGFGTFVNLYAPQPILPQFRQIFGASELQVSLTVSAPVLAVALAAPFVGLLADAVGRKRVIVAAMLGLSLPTAFTAFAANLNQLLFWRFCQGLFIPGIIAAAMAYVSEESHRQMVGSTMATYVTGTVVGGFAGRFATGLISPYWGWRTAFLVLAVATFAGGLATWRLLPRSTRFVAHSGRGAAFGSLRAHMRNPQLLATYAVGFNVLFCLVGAFTYVNFYLADRPFSLGAAALSSIFAVYLVGAVLTPVGGQILNRVGYRRALVGAVFVAIAGALMTLVQWLPAVIAGLTCCACGAFVCQSAASSQVGETAGKARSSAAGLYVAFYYFGGCLGSVLPGLIWHHAGWTGCVALMVCMQAITAAIAYKLWQD